MNRAGKCTTTTWPRPSGSPTHLPFVQVTYLGTTENKRSGTGAICHTAPITDRRSHKIIYSGISEATRNDRIYLMPLVRAGTFELPTPCAQGSFRYHSKTACFQLFTFQADAVGLLSPVEPC